MDWIPLRKKKDVPGGLWLRCEDCSRTVYRKEVEEGYHVCPKCGYHFKLSWQQRSQYLLDVDSFDEMFANLAPTDPLSFTDRESYAGRLERYQGQTGMKDAAVVGSGTIDGSPVMLGILDFRFMGGSMGSVVGEKIALMLEEAGQRKVPAICVSASGGARMQEGVLSVFQMAKTATAVARYCDRGGFFISILTNPTTAGVMASFASLGDVIIAEPKAQIGFTGRRVIEETIGEKLPKDFQTSEFALEHGLVDMIVHRKDLKRTVARLISYAAVDTPEN